MPTLAELYVATRTRNTADADTENLPVLVVQRGSDIVFTKPLYGPWELLPNVGDGLGQAAAGWASRLTPSMPLVKVTPRITFGNWW